MSLSCPFCSYNLGERANIYGTVCSKCGTFIKSGIQSSLQKNTKKILEKQQHQIRQFLRNKILGDNNGNQAK
jgi:ribosomal protein L37AE/L43A